MPLIPEIEETPNRWANEREARSASIRRVSFEQVDVLKESRPSRREFWVTNTESHVDMGGHVDIGSTEDRSEDSSRETPSENQCLSFLVQRLLVPEKVESTLDVLLDMKLYTEESTSIRRELGKTDICSNIVRVMDLNLGKLNVFCKCCMLMINLTLKPSMKKRIDALIKAGAARTIVSFMKHYREEFNVQKCALGVLQNLLCGTARHKKIVMQSGAVKMIVSVMKKYPKETQIIKSACACLCNITYVRDQAINQDILNLGGGARLAEAHFHFFGKNDQIERFALTALESLFTVSNHERRGQVLTSV